MTDFLDDLEALARAPTREERAVLLRRLTDLFFRAGPRPGARVLELFEDVICRVLTQVDVPARVEASDRFAVTPHAPRRIVVALAEDDIPVAEPVLKHSVVLTEGDLLRLAGTKGPAHLTAMSRRVFVSPVLSDALIDRGIPEVHRALAANDGAQITETGFGKLIRGAECDHVLQELMALRANLPDAVKRALLPVLAAEVRRRVIQRLRSSDEDVIIEALEGELDVIVTRLEGMSGDHVAYTDLQIAYDEGAITLDEALIEACRADRHDWVVDLLAFAGPLERQRVTSALLERDPKPTAVLLKAHGCAPETFKMVLDMRAKRLGIGSNAPRIVEDYAALDPDVARTVLRHLRARIAVA